MVNRTAGGNQSGLDNFIFGQVASMVRRMFYDAHFGALVILVVSIGFGNGSCSCLIPILPGIRDE